jgi:hypothetical protein
MPDESRLELEEAIEALGGVIEEFRPHAANIVASRIIGPFCIIAGVTIAFYVVRGGDFSQPRLIVLGAGALFLFSGSIMLLRSLRWTTYRVLRCRDGLVEARGGNVRVYRWDDIEKVTQFEQRDPHLLVVTVPKRWRIFCPTNPPLTLDLDTTSEINRLVEILRAETGARGIPWDRQV